MKDYTIIVYNLRADVIDNKHPEFHYRAPTLNRAIEFVAFVGGTANVVSA